MIRSLLIARANRIRADHSEIYPRWREDLKSVVAAEQLRESLRREGQCRSSSLVGVRSATTGTASRSSSECIGEIARPAASD